MKNRFRNLNTDQKTKMVIVGIIVLIASFILTFIFTTALLTSSNNPTPIKISPTRFEVLAIHRYGDDPDDFIKIVCDHFNGTIIYENGRGGVSVHPPGEVKLTCDVIDGVK